MRVMKPSGGGLASLAVTAAVVGVAGISPAAAATVDCTTNAAITSVSYKVTHLDGTSTVTQVLSNERIAGTVRPGDVIVGTFGLNPACPTVVVSGASYFAPSAIFSDANQAQQILFDSTTKTVSTGGKAITVSLTLRIPASGISFGTCPNPHNSGSKAFNGNGGSATSGNQYASTCDGRASANGNGNGGANGKPCQGCVGNADNKNPPGQFPNGSDHNNGYECDGNNGIAKGNPAHSSCLRAHFQMEFVVGPVIPKFIHGGYPDNVKIPGGSTLG